MENPARLQLVDETPEQMTVSGAGTSATLSETSSFHTALEECLPSGHDVALGDRSSAGCSMQQNSEYFSSRVEEMMRSKSQFSSAVEHEIEHSRAHWSEVLGRSEPSEDDDQDRENRKVFAKLLIDPQWMHGELGHFSNFFNLWPSTWKLGRKIAEGGQAEIFEFTTDDGTIEPNHVLKVFKRGTRLSDLKNQWPRGLLRGDVGICITLGGRCMVDENRFAFLLARCWSDLRKLIDEAKQKKNNQGPPFPYKWNGETLHAKIIMLQIAFNMKSLHDQGIIHRDLKAANILLHGDSGSMLSIVADYECSIGVVGTRFWRAPEILLALKKPGSVIDFIEKMDVYSYGMTCFEVVTGRLPFEGELKDCKESYELVIAGRRPKLPSDLDVGWKNLIERCWNPIPNERPSFDEIFNEIWSLPNDGVQFPTFDLDHVVVKDLIERFCNPIPNERPSFDEVCKVLSSFSMN